MTYLDYHLWFNLPVMIALLAWALITRRLCLAHVACIGAVAVIAFVFTTPWDNLAVARGYWDFDWDRVTPVELTAFRQTWRLPAEEYAFFVIETIIVGLVCLLFLPRPRFQPPVSPARSSRR